MNQVNDTIKVVQENGDVIDLKDEECFKIQLLLHTPWATRFNSTVVDGIRVVQLLHGNTAAKWLFLEKYARYIPVIPAVFPVPDTDAKVHMILPIGSLPYQTTIAFDDFIIIQANHETQTLGIWCQHSTRYPPVVAAKIDLMHDCPPIEENITKS